MKERRACVTQDQISAAADRMAASGEEPTCSRLVDQLGGSMGTISRGLREWRASREIIRAREIQISEEIHTAVEKQIRSEVEAARKRVSALLAAHESDLAELTKAMTAAEDHIGGLQQQLEIARRDADRQVWELANQARTLDGLRQTLDEEHRLREKAEARLQRAQVLLENLTQISDDNSRLAGELAAEREKRMTAEIDAAVARERGEALAARLAEMQAGQAPFAAIGGPDCSPAGV